MVNVSVCVKGNLINYLFMTFTHYPCPGYALQVPSIYIVDLDGAKTEIQQLALIEAMQARVFHYKLEEVSQS